MTRRSTEGMLKPVTDEADRLARLLRALPDPLLRTAFLRDYLSTGEPGERAEAIEQLCAAGFPADSAARGPMLAVVLLLAGLGEDPLLDRLGEQAAKLGLVHLRRLLRRAPETRESSEARTPDFGSGRALSLGERKALARKPNRRHFDKLLLDPHASVISLLLQNPRLTEDDLIRLAARRPGHPEVQRAIARSPWLSRPRVRLTLILNPVTPSAVAIPLLAGCTRLELAEVCESRDTSATLQATARELLELRAALPR